MSVKVREKDFAAAVNSVTMLYYLWYYLNVFSSEEVNSLRFSIALAGAQGLVTWKEKEKERPLL